MKELVLLLAGKDKDALGTVRCFPGLKAASNGDLVWLRGIPEAEKTAPEIRSLPALSTFLLDEQDHLFPVDALTPVDKLETLDWQPLVEFIPVVLPVSPLPGQVSRKYAVRLSPSGRSEEGTALLTSLAAWKQYAEHAPAVRLAALRFAVSDKNEVLIFGTPLVPLPGKELWLRGNILLPCGYDFDPPVVAALITAELNVSAGTLLVFMTDGSWRKIPASAFVPATRSAIRLTEERKVNG